MKGRVYLRLAQSTRGLRVAATSKPSTLPLTDQRGVALPTVAFGLELELSDDAFCVPIVAELVVSDDMLRPVVDVEAVEPVEGAS